MRQVVIAIIGNMRWFYRCGRPNSLALVFNNQNKMASKVNTHSFPRHTQTHTHPLLRFFFGSFSAVLYTWQHSSPHCCLLCFLMGVNGQSVGEASHLPSPLPQTSPQPQRSGESRHMTFYSLLFPPELFSHLISEEKYSSNGAMASADISFLCRSLVEFFNCSLLCVARL